MEKELELELLKETCYEIYDKYIEGLTGTEALNICSGILALTVQQETKSDREEMLENVHVKVNKLLDGE